MRKRHHSIHASILLGWLLLTLAAGIVVQQHMARAAAPAFPPGYNLTVTESANTITYGSTAPDVQAQLTVPPGDNPLTNPGQFYFMIDTQAFIPDGHSSGGSPYTFTLKGTSVSNTLTIPAGQHSIVATYFSIVLNQTLTSAAIPLTVQKLTPTISCGFLTAGLYLVNSPVTFMMGESVNDPPIDWQHATYSVTFIGAHSFTTTNLTASSLGQGLVNTPPVGDFYKYQCSFSGTSNFNAAQSPVGSSILAVTQGHPAGIKLYSTPTTITAGTNASLDIRVSGGSGLPTPTGEVALFLGPYTSTNRIAISGGQVTLQIVFPTPLPSPSLRICYYGDPVYNQSCVDFPFTNPAPPSGATPIPPTPIPTGISTAASPTTTTTTASTPAPSSTSAASSTPTAAAGTTSNIHPTDPPLKRANTLPWIAGLGFLVLAAGGSGVFFVLRKRARAAAPPAPAMLPPSEDE
jgi:hypothetical protein